MAGGPGFDSGLTESESAVLPDLTRIETSAISQRDLIVDVVAQLFIKNGYAATPCPRFLNTEAAPRLPCDTQR